MIAYFVAQFTVKDKDIFASYAQKAGPIIASFGGELLFKSLEGETLEGNNPHKGIVVFTFQDQETLKKWHDSPEYQSLVEGRRQAADMVFTGYAGSV